MAKENISAPVIGDENIIDKFKQRLEAHEQKMNKLRHMFDQEISTVGSEEFRNLLKEIIVEYKALKKEFRELRKENKSEELKTLKLLYSL